MLEKTVEQIMQKIGDASCLYHRLVILALPSGFGKTAALQIVHDRLSVPMVNINLELSLRMLDLTERQRSLQLPRLLADILDSLDADTILLDNSEVLFDIALKQDPLLLLQGFSRNKTLVVAWNGSVNGEHLLYATQGHPEYRRYSLQNFLVVTPEIGA